MTDHTVSVAPMMDWTDRHCRYLHRILCPQAVLYTEMVTAEAVIHGDKEKLLGFSPSEHPLVLQLGGSDPDKLAVASRIGAEWGYNEINVNVGCPSDRVQSGRFGACLMAEPDVVVDCIQAMQKSTSIPITVKCRIGIDDQDPAKVLPAFLEKLQATGCKHIIIHGRKAWLKGLSPKDNRTIPPLDYELVYRMKQQFPDLKISINGGITTKEQVLKHLKHVDGVMIGREAYHNPLFLNELSQMIYNTDAINPDQLIETMTNYVGDIMEKGGRFHSVSRHMLGLFTGLKGARGWRRLLSEKGTMEGVDPSLLGEAFENVRQHLEIRE